MKEGVWLLPERKEKSYVSMMTSYWQSFVKRLQELGYEVIGESDAERAFRLLKKVPRHLTS
jgi:hypothetical protein